MSRYKLACFDLDGTVIDDTVFVWQTIHDYLDTSNDERMKAQDAYFSGKISYRQWAEHDIMLWKEAGATKEKIEAAIRPMRLMKGARETLDTLRDTGMELAVISGSLDIALEHVLPDYDDYFEVVYINKLIFDGNGEISAIDTNPYDISRKGEGLTKIASNKGIDLSQCVFVGDHFNDVSVAKLAGLSIAFNCKSEELAEVSDVIIKEPDLTNILKHILGSHLNR
ncbi:HAD-IB family phosphatase [Acidobacteriota bacterium]